MTHRLATNYAKNYCNQTIIVKVIVENVVTCFFGGHGVPIKDVIRHFYISCISLYEIRLYARKQKGHSHQTLMHMPKDHIHLPHTSHRETVRKLTSFKNRNSVTSYINIALFIWRSKINSHIVIILKRSQISTSNSQHSFHSLTFWIIIHISCQSNSAATWLVTTTYKTSGFLPYISCNLMYDFSCTCKTITRSHSTFLVTT